MLFQAQMSADWILGVSIMFGLALVMTYSTKRDTRTFILWVTIFAGFVVWGGLLPLWVLVICVISLVLLVAVSIRSPSEEG